MCTTGHRIGSGHDRHRPARRHHLPDHRRLHIHARDAEGDVTQDSAVYEEIGAAIRAEVPDVILNYTTGGSVGMSDDERLGSVAARHELASLDCGSMNFGEAVFINSPAFIDRCAGEMRAAGVKQAREIFAL
jgi:3-keto-5-aminohexanoate cleavage enzyme